MADDPNPKQPQPTAETVGIFAALSSKRAIGPYRLIDLLGEGGMGEVWMAEQVEPLRRTVALKLIKAGMDTKAVVARFESERQALALMDHPNIARVFDAGSTPEGRPYFVMEYVPGQPITAYCDRQKLALKQRLELFIQVCEGVQHAHQKAIIHRDLKPSNVLVQEIDKRPVPKIIDFGLAKATGQRLTEATMYTEVGARVGTPAYMSPEQADANERNIDTRTDVYSLGVILYELLTGVLPFEPQDTTADEMLRKIRDEEAPRPSTKLRSSTQNAVKVAEQRQEQPQTLIRHLRGELDWIVMKALEKDRGRRYGTPTELAADVQRYLKNEPVQAGAPSTLYRAQKFVRRHRFGVATASVVLLLLIGFAVTMAVQAKRIAKERDRANREAEASKRVADFMTEMFKVSDPSNSRGNTITAREILDKASKEIETGLSKDPELQARLMNTMANTYYGLGLYSEATGLYQKSISVREKLFGANDTQVLDTRTELAWVLSEVGKLDEAEKMATQTLEADRRVLPKDDARTTKTMSTLSWILQREGKFPEAEKLERGALAIQQKTAGPDDHETIDTMLALSATTGEEGKYDESVQVEKDAIAAIRRTMGADNPTAISAETNLAVTLMYAGKYEDSAKVLQGNIEQLKRVLGPEHPKTLFAEAVQGSNLERLGKPDEAIATLRSTVDTMRRVMGADNPDTLSASMTLATALSDAGKFAEAESIARDVLDRYRKTVGNDNPHTTDAMGTLATVLVHEKRFAEADKFFAESVEIIQKSGRTTDLGSALYNYACGDAIAGSRDKAFEHLTQAIATGYAPAPEAMEADNDLKSLHADPRFAETIADARKRAGQK
ncbi:serine/threonine protein kinase with TPR repeats [Candidatus Koribacter versatilis Ellin345]|uniref:Serine/threonine protein kinase with TPR repeats n=1 Tax=Koribacter versatilis (strain Ellin345) TaxID=204669 RepID=Q1IP89_KORVE|nr:serine/threonine-protein kinase [Candidatus Koribacter versatilis]ABF41311.1 serine/threonine protein kinase with TPR repeats [Candidatus Koribacter versatilis Ellin345]